MSGDNVLRPLWTEEKSADLKEMWMQGLSARQIGAVFGVSRNTVIGKAHRIGLPHRKQTGPNGGRLPAKPHEHKHVLRRTPNPKHFIWEAGEPLIEQVHELLGPPVSLIDLAGIDPLEKNYDCRWPVDGGSCGMPHVVGYSYCKPHCRLAYYKAPKISDVERAVRGFQQRKRNAARQHA